VYFSKKIAKKDWHYLQSTASISPPELDFQFTYSSMGSTCSWQLPLTNSDPKHPTKTFAPLFLHKYFMFSRQNHGVFLRLWMQKLTVKTLKGRIFLLKGKICKNFKFLPFIRLILDWQSQGPICV
jgi:hypothetical protein